MNYEADCVTGVFNEMSPLVTVSVLKLRALNTYVHIAIVIFSIFLLGKVLIMFQLVHSSYSVLICQQLHFVISERGIILTSLTPFAIASNINIKHTSPCYHLLYSSYKKSFPLELLFYLSLKVFFFKSQLVMS